MRKQICVDFDGVIHWHRKPFHKYNAIDDVPVPGAFEWIKATMTDYDVLLWSCRLNQWGVKRAMKKWFRKYGLDEFYIKKLRFAKKPGACMYIDDRGFRFKGEYPTDVEEWPWSENRAIHKWS